MALWTVGWAQVGNKIDAPGYARPWGQGQELAHPRSVRAATAELAFEAVLNVSDAVVAEGWPVPVLGQQVV